MMVSFLIDLISIPKYCFAISHPSFLTKFSENSHKYSCFTSKNTINRFQNIHFLHFTRKSKTTIRQLTKPPTPNLTILL